MNSVINVTDVIKAEEADETDVAAMMT